MWTNRVKWNYAIASQFHSSEHKTCVYHVYNVGPTSSTRWFNIVQMLYKCYTNVLLAATSFFSRSTRRWRSIGALSGQRGGPLLYGVLSHLCAIVEGWKLFKIKKVINMISVVSFALIIFAYSHRVTFVIMLVHSVISACNYMILDWLLSYQICLGYLVIMRII